MNHDTDSPHHAEFVIPVKCPTNVVTPANEYPAGSLYWWRDGVSEALADRDLQHDAAYWREQTFLARQELGVQSGKLTLIRQRAQLKLDGVTSEQGRRVHDEIAKFLRLIGLLGIVALLVMGCSRESSTSDTERPVIGPQAATTTGSLCTTEGALATSYSFHTLGHDDGAVRAELPPGADASGTGAVLRFVVDGPAHDLVPLGDGTIRHQACLKLLNADPCNLVYVCVREEGPHGPWVQVQAKENPGEHTSDACGSGGYHQVSGTPTGSILSSLFAGGEKEVGALVAPDGSLAVEVDGQPAWSGQLDTYAAQLRGPAGLRGDNLSWSGRLEAGAAPCGAL